LNEKVGFAYNIRIASQPGGFWWDGQVEGWTKLKDGVEESMVWNLSEVILIVR